MSFRSSASQPRSTPLDSDTKIEYELAHPSFSYPCPRTLLLPEVPTSSTPYLILQIKEVIGYDCHIPHASTNPVLGIEIEKVKRLVLSSVSGSTTGFFGTSCGRGVARRYLIGNAGCRMEMGFWM